jgi:hypothetical protein
MAVVLPGRPPSRIFIKLKKASACDDQRDDTGKAIAQALVAGDAGISESYF